MYIIHLNHCHSEMIWLYDGEHNVAYLLMPTDLHSESVQQTLSLLSLPPTRDVNTQVLGYPGPVWPTRVPIRVP